ncbi:MAG: glycosyltransferase family 2 protein [Candidatus Liptonbacteria bacterium]|nr:glycosyltransferase family 2 protein [Candidatus Liptonbacteria bacterium]
MFRATRPMARPYLSIIIPAYNESKRLPLTLIDMDKRLSGVAYTYEILVMNDGSKDNTAEVARKMSENIKNLKVVDNPVNRGKGAVVRDGMLIAQGNIRLFTDADNSTSIDQFNGMMAHFKAGYDVVIGSRAVTGAKLDPPEPIYRQIPGKAGNLIIQALLLPGLWDTQCGFKAFSERATEEIFSMMKITGWGFDIESLALAKKLGYKIKEVPVHWVNAPGSKVGASAYLKVLLETLKIRLWLWMGKYPIKSQNA